MRAAATELIAQHSGQLCSGGWERLGCYAPTPVLGCPADYAMCALPIVHTVPPPSALALPSGHTAACRTAAAPPPCPLGTDRCRTLTMPRPPRPAPRAGEPVSGQVRAPALLVTFVTDGGGEALGFVARWVARLATRAPSARPTRTPQTGAALAAAAKARLGRAVACLAARPSVLTPVGPLAGWPRGRASAPARPLKHAEQAPCAGSPKRSRTRRNATRVGGARGVGA